MEVQKWYLTKILTISCLCLWLSCMICIWIQVTYTNYWYFSPDVAGTKMAKRKRVSSGTLLLFPIRSSHLWSPHFEAKSLHRADQNWKWAYISIEDPKILPTCRRPTWQPRSNRIHILPTPMYVKSVRVPRVRLSLFRRVRNQIGRSERKIKFAPSSNDDGQKPCGPSSRDIHI